MSLINSRQIDIGSMERDLEIKHKTEKTANFFFELIADGLVGPILKVPFEGTILDIDAYCTTKSDEDTLIDIEKISEEEFNSRLDTWESILGNKISIPGGFTKSDYSHNFATKHVAKNDFFRIRFLETGPVGARKIENLTIQIQIEI